MRRILRAMGWTMCLVAAAGCGGGGGGAPPLSVQVLMPDRDVEIGATTGGSVTIRYVEGAEAAGATTTLLADGDGNPGTSDDQVVIASNRSARPGEEQELLWDVAAMPAGTYRIMAVTRAGAGEAVSEAPGRLLINVAPSFAFTWPSPYKQVLQGSDATIEYTSDDPDDAALLTFHLDPDGDASTVDGIPISYPLFDGNGAPQQLVFSTRDVPVGFYGVLAHVWDGTNEGLAVMSARNLAVAPGVISLSSGGAGGGGEINPWFGRALDIASNGDFYVIDSGSGSRFRRMNAVGGGLWGETPDGTCFIRGIAHHPQGGCVIAGTYQYSLRLGNGQPGETTLSTPGSMIGSSEGFLARYDDDGLLLWARTTHGGQDDTQTSLRSKTTLGRIVILSDGSILVGGSLDYRAVLGQGEPDETTLLAQPPGNAGYLLSDFVARYERDGALGWALLAHTTLRSATSASAMIPFGVRADGQMFVGIRYGVELVTGAGAQTLDPPGSRVLRLGSDGSVLDAWQPPAGVSVSDGAVTASGELRISGYYGSAEPTFGVGEPGETTLPAGDVDHRHQFAATFRTDGTLRWARRLAISQRTDPPRPREAHQGGFALLGTLVEAPDDPLIVAPGQVGETEHDRGAGGIQAWIAVFDDDGTLRWTAPLPGSRRDDLAFHRSGNLWLLRGTSLHGFGAAGD